MFLTMLFDDPPHYLTVVAIVIVSIVLHELGHAIAATWEGDPTPRIRGHLTWNPVVHMGWLAIGLLLVVGISFGRTPVTPAMFRHRRWGEVVVAAAGPLTNLALAVIAAVVVTALEKAGRLDFADGMDPPFIVSFWSMMLVLNASLFVLNLIPLPPLDGFTVASSTFDLGELGMQIRRLGMFPLILVILFVNSGAFHLIVGVLVGGLRTATHLAMLPF